LEARQSARVDLGLPLAQVQQTVNVEAAAEQINTENGVIGDSKPTEALVEMPLNFRAQTTSPLAALALSPNIITNSMGNIEVGGATYSMTGYSVDGISTANIVANGSLLNAYPSSEGLAELKVTAFNDSAEFSQVADVTFITKSGTNQFHGSQFAYLQNDALDATILNFTSKRRSGSTLSEAVLGARLQFLTSTTAMTRHFSSSTMKATAAGPPCQSNIWSRTRRKEAEISTSFLSSIRKAEIQPTY
jgi:hypothetical protein